MIFFVSYAAAVWLLVFRFRRRWQGFAVLAFGTGAVWFVSHVLFGGPVQARQGNWATGLAMAYLYEFAIFIVGLFLVLQSRTPPVFERCPRCRYDLRGNTTGVCPECGTRSAMSEAMPAASRGHDAGPTLSIAQRQAARKRYIESLARGAPAPKPTVAEVKPEDDRGPRERRERDRAPVSA